MKKNAMNTLTSTATLVILAAALAACGQSDDGKTPGQQLDSAVASTQEQAAELKSDAKEGAAEARETMGEVGDKLAAGGREVKDAAKDASITASVSAGLVKDAGLSALRIDVDTHDGVVSLSGTAPNDAAKDRATDIARAVDGVVSVDNRLTVQPKS